MRTLFFIIQKEFIQIFRDRLMPRIIIGVPLLQMLVLAYAATFEVKDTRLVVADLSLSEDSRQLIAHFKGSRFFRVVAVFPNFKEAEHFLLKGKAHQILVIPEDFSKASQRGEISRVQILTDAVDALAAGVRTGYALQVIESFGKNINPKLTSISNEGLHFKELFWYNPSLNYQTYMVPGILVVLVTILGMFLSALNIVREKERGTIEQINVTPIKKYQFIAGKLLPFWLLALFGLAFGLLLAKIIFQLPMLGSIPLVFFTASMYLIVVLSFGLIISTLAETQQQAMFIAWFFAIVFLMLSGLFTPIDSMPMWAKVFNYFNPVAYFIKALRMILLKGSGIKELWSLLSILVVYAVASLSFATKWYSKTSS